MIVVITKYTQRKEDKDRWTSDRERKRQTDGLQTERGRDRQMDFRQREEETDRDRGVTYPVRSELVPDGLEPVKRVKLVVLVQQLQDVR